MCENFGGRSLYSFTGGTLYDLSWSSQLKYPGATAHIFSRRPLLKYRTFTPMRTRRRPTRRRDNRHRQRWGMGYCQQRRHRPSMPLIFGSPRGVWAQPNAAQIWPITIGAKPPKRATRYESRWQAAHCLLTQPRAAARGGGARSGGLLALLFYWYPAARLRWTHRPVSPGAPRWPPPGGSGGGDGTAALVVGVDGSATVVAARRSGDGGCGRRSPRRPPAPFPPPPGRRPSGSKRVAWSGWEARRRGRRARPAHPLRARPRAALRAAAVPQHGCCEPQHGWCEPQKCHYSSLRLPPRPPPTHKALLLPHS